MVIRTPIWGWKTYTYCVYISVYIIMQYLAVKRSPFHSALYIPSNSGKNDKSKVFVCVCGCVCLEMSISACIYNSQSRASCCYCMLMHPKQFKCHLTHILYIIYLHGEWTVLCQVKHTYLFRLRFSLFWNGILCALRIQEICPSEQRSWDKHTHTPSGQSGFIFLIFLRKEREWEGNKIHFQYFGCVHSWNSQHVMVCFQLEKFVSTAFNSCMPTYTHTHFWNSNNFGDNIFEHTKIHSQTQRMHVAVIVGCSEKIHHLLF